MFPYMFAIDLAIALATVWTLAQSVDELRETYLDYRAEANPETRTSETAYVRTRYNLRVEFWQLAQVVMLAWLGVRTTINPPPPEPGMFWDPSQFMFQGLWILLFYVLLKGGGRREERRGRRLTRDTYYREFGPPKTMVDRAKEKGE